MLSKKSICFAALVVTPWIFLNSLKGYYELLEKVFDTWKYLKLTESSIKLFHRELLKYVDKELVWDEVRGIK